MGRHDIGVRWQRKLLAPAWEEWPTSLRNSLRYGRKSTSLTFVSFLGSLRLLSQKGGIRKTRSDRVSRILKCSLSYVSRIWYSLREKYIFFYVFIEIAFEDKSISFILSKRHWEHTYFKHFMIWKMIIHLRSSKEIKFRDNGKSRSVFDKNILSQ